MQVMNSESKHNKGYISYTKMESIQKIKKEYPDYFPTKNLRKNPPSWWLKKTSVFE